MSSNAYDFGFLVGTGIGMGVSIVQPEFASVAQFAPEVVAHATDAAYKWMRVHTRVRPRSDTRPTGSARMPVYGSPKMPIYGSPKMPVFGSPPMPGTVVPKPKEPMRQVPGSTATRRRHKYEYYKRPRAKKYFVYK